MTVAAMTTPFPVLSRGKSFKVLACPEMWHPSWWSFNDEVETRELWWRVLPGDAVLDVGADFGSYALSALAQGAAHVHAWSPPFKRPTEAIECATLTASAGLNGWTERLTCLPTGLWSKPGFLAAFDGPRNAEFFPTLEGALARINGESGHCAAFEVGTLDALGIAKADWLKIDTEGCELAVLTGGIETIKRCRPIVLLEQHYHLDADCEKKADAFLAELGYEKVGTRPHYTIAHSLYRPGMQ
jgi:FkbM family methyltransferase